MSAGTNRLQNLRQAGSRGILAIAAGVAGLVIGGGTAVAGNEGGIEAPPPPEITDVSCSVRCLDVRTVAETGRIEIVGEGLAGTSVVKFPSESGKLKVEPREVDDTSLIAEVPEGADSGAVRAIDEYGAKAVAPVDLEVVPADAIDEVDELRVTKAEAAPERSYFNGREPSTVDYLFEADAPADIRIDVIEQRSGTTVDSFVQQNQKPFASNSASWNGLSESKAIAPNGDYRFRVSPLSGGQGAVAPFSYFDHIFPLRGGKVTYGEGLGAGRGHQGQDVITGCGTKVVAARGGKVQVNAYQSAAGNYLVIDGRKTGKDYTYMHLAERGMVKEGERVRTGDVIGYVSDTGNATTCLLHFELWSAPGWYEGGKPVDPTRPLKKWDGWS